MSIWLNFVYDTAAETQFEEPSTSFQGLRLFDFEIDFLGPEGFEVPGFVLEFKQEQAETERQWRERYNIQSVDDIANLEDPSVCGECMWTGPSKPFPPEEAREWAIKWICLLRELPEKVRRVYCSDFWVDYMTSDLEQLIRQSSCAESHGVKLRFCIV